MNQNLKTGTKTGLLISAILWVLAVICDVNNLITLLNLPNVPMNIAIMVAFSLVVLFSTMVYVFVGYKKPHGDLLRMTFLVFAIYLGIIALAKFEVSFAAGLGDMISAIMISYIAGRLNKIVKNKTLLVCTGIIILLSQIAAMLQDTHNRTIFETIGIFVPLFVFTALSFSYIARYEEHKAAGLEDAN